MASIVDNRKERGRGRPPTGIGKPVGLRLYPDLERLVDEWASKQFDSLAARGNSSSDRDCTGKETKEIHSEQIASSL